MRRLLIVVATISLLAGCTSASETDTADDSASTSEAGETTTGEPIDPGSIESMEEGILWARTLDDTAAADELSVGVDRIIDHLLDEEIEFETSNEIGQALIALQTEVESAPESAGTRVADLKAIADRIESATGAGATP
jgi:hypothetical protein